MHNKGRFPNVFSGARLRPDGAVLVVIVFLFVALSAQPVQGQTFSVIYNFTGGADNGPEGGLTMDGTGNFYGTASGYIQDLHCHSECGEVFKLTHESGGWSLIPLYRFNGGSDGSLPFARVVIGPDGNLYGTTTRGGGSGCGANVFGPGCGTVFTLSPAGGNETPIYRITQGKDGTWPAWDNLVFDRAGNIFATSIFGGPWDSGGEVYELTRSSGGWTKTVLYNFTGGVDGRGPRGVIFDGSGNLYGATISGGSQRWGAVYQLVAEGSGWTQRVIYNFQGHSGGANPGNALVMDQSGNLYGTTNYGGTGGCDYGMGCGVVYELSPSDGNWTFTVLHSFTYADSGSVEPLTIDAAGNLYGTAMRDGVYGCGSVFKLTRSGSDWTYSSLHDFTCGSDGGWPTSNVTLDANGNLYGTATVNGANGVGVIWKITR
jgi:uncharacterized repeat protein (TIGR03803 family)